jgi:hypothetical protein
MQASQALATKELQTIRRSNRRLRMLASGLVVGQLEGSPSLDTPTECGVWPSAPTGDDVICRTLGESLRPIS